MAALPERLPDGFGHCTTPQAAIEREVWSSLAKVMLTSNEFLYVD